VSLFLLSFSKLLSAGFSLNLFRLLLLRFLYFLFVIFYIRNYEYLKQCRVGREQSRMIAFSLGELKGLFSKLSAFSVIFLFRIVVMN
jgi:hypothetical protein